MIFGLRRTGSGPVRHHPARYCNGVYKRGPYTAAAHSATLLLNANSISILGLAVRCDVTANTFSFRAFLSQSMMKSVVGLPSTVPRRETLSPILLNE
jgi:hypothetical protein